MSETRESSSPPAGAGAPSGSPPPQGEGQGGGAAARPPATSAANRTPQRLRILRNVLIGTTTIAVAASIAFAVLVYQQNRGPAQPRIETYDRIPAFELTDHLGQPFAAERLRGQVTIANFIFTRCDTVCPVFSMKMKRLQERTADWPTPPQLLSFSVDPAHDTPEVLAEFAARYGADPARWRFLTGTPEHVQEVVRGGMKIAMEREGTLESGAPNIVHGEHFVLLDQHLDIRGYYYSNDLQRLDDLLRDARWLQDNAAALE